MHQKTRRFLIKTLKVCGWILLSSIALLLIVIALVQIPAIQQKITQKAISFLREKIKTEVTLESLYISFPKNIVVEGLYLEDQQRDTLLYVGKLSVDTDLWALTRNEIQLNNISLENTIANINRTENDSAFNFTYIIDAFAGDSTAVPDTLEEKGWNFSLRKIILENIRAQYHDKLTGNNLDLNLGDFELEIDEFDLEKYVFGIEDVALENTTISFVQTKLPEVTEEAAEQSVDTAVLDLNFDQIALTNVKAKYVQEITGQRIQIDIGETVIEANKINLKNQELDFNEIALSNTFISYQQHKQESSGKEPAASAGSNIKTSNNSQPTADSSKPWKIRLAELTFEDNSIQYYDFTKPYQYSAIDFSHLWLTNLDTEIRDVIFSSADIQANIENLSFQERSGFALKTFKSKLTVSEDTASVTDFLIDTGHSNIQFEAAAGYDSLEQLAKKYQDANIRMEIKPSYIGIRDILYFNPALIDSLPLVLPEQTVISMDALAHGIVRDLSLHHLSIKTLSDTEVNLNGKVVGLPTPEKLNVNLELSKFFTSKNDLKRILPDTLLPDSISLPQWINLAATYKGSTTRAGFTAALTSSMGGAEVKGNMDLDSTSATRGFSGDLVVNEFNLGELLMQPQTIGKLNLMASLNSVGLTKEEMNSELEATIKNFEYQNYNYENFNLKASLKNNILKGIASLKDENLDFVLDGEYAFQEEIPKYDFTLDVRNVDLKALNLNARPLKFRGTLDVDMETADFKVLNGSVGIRKVAVFNGDALYAVDSLLFASIDQKGRSEINIDSDIMKGSFEGTLNIFTMPAVLREYFNNYYSLHDSVEQSYEDPQRFTFNLELRKTDLITDILVPELSSFEPGEISGEFDSKKQQLNLRFDIANILYSNIGIQSVELITNSDSSKLNYNFYVRKLKIDSLLVDGLELNGTVSHDSIKTDFIVRDSIALKKYVLGGTFYSREKEFEFRLDPEQVRLNYHDWTVPADNYVRFGGAKVIAQNVQLVNGREKIIIESKADPKSPLFIGFRELNLEYLASMISYERPLSGLLQGDINLYTTSENFTFTSDLTIKDFSIAQVEWGDIALKVKQEVTNRFDVNFNLTGNNTNIRTEGFYTAGESPAMDINTRINGFDLAILQPLAATQFQNLKGNLSGNFDVTGSPQDPAIRGNLTLSNTEFFSLFLKSAFKVKNETIVFNNNGITFDKFDLVDSRNNVARLDGSILTKDYRDFTFRLNLNTNNFRLLNTTEKDNELFYGLVDINSNARIRGTIDNPEVDTEISLSDGSHLTYIVPQSEAAVLEQQGIVRFVDKTFKDDPFTRKIQDELADTVKSQFTGIDLTAKIELTDKESFTVIIDPTTNDQLTVKGNTTLTLQMDPTGDMQLTGRYEISEGTYNLSFYKFVKREFQIEKGSTMTWSGDPLNAEMDIRAIFQVETAPIDLVINQLQGLDQRQMNQYRQRLPFLVYLNINGQLLKPEIAFELDMPMEERNALQGYPYARIQDINTRESDLNKQVFALLILKRFVSDNPFASESGGGLEGTARTSVSKILTEQLNRLSENVKGVELSFDVKSYEDYSSGEAQGQTELELGLSKSLLNDRLIVKVSGNVDVEGQRDTNRGAADYIGDLALEYMLTEDGRFRVTGFRNSNYDMIDGELIETGAGLIYIKDYNTLRELFRANEKEKK